MVELREFHDYRIMLLIIILVWVGGAIIRIILGSY